MRTKISVDFDFYHSRSFINLLSTPCIPQSWETFEAGGYPQTPSKGASLLCTPQLLNELINQWWKLQKRYATITLW
jgi:hypothetical protein